MRNGIRKFKLVSVILGVVIFIMFSQNENAVALAYDGTVNFGTTASTLGTTSTPGDTITASDVLSTGLDFIGSNGTSTSTTLRIFSAGGNAGGYFRMSGVSGMTINYLEIRAREGIFDLPSLYLNPVNGGSTSYNIQALDSSFQLTGSIITSSMTPSTWTLVNTNFIGIAGFRITPANGNMIGVDDIFIQNPRLASSTYNVMYNGNGNTGGTVPTDSTSYTSGTIVTAASNSGNLVKTGYTFAGWNTAANGSGTDYAAGSGTFSIAANTTLYAKWTPVPTTYTVTYNGNGNTGGTVPTDSTSYTSGTTVTAASNSGNLVKTGYTFAGWNTAANGSGTDYAAGSGTFSIAANTTLYAKWTAVPTTYTVTYDGNGNTGGTVPTDSTSYTGGQTVTAASNSGSLVKTGYTFAGWNTAANGSGTDYAVGSGTFSIVANTTLYAKWTAVPTTYTVTYDGNGNTGGTVPTDSASYTSGQTVTAASNSGNLVKTGYTFAGWNTLANGSGTDYAAGSGTFSIAANTTLYAKWTPVSTYTATLSQTGTHTFTGATVGYTSISPRTITVTNTGTGSLTGLGVALSGTNASSFTLGSLLATTVSTENTTTFSVKPNDNLAAGTYTATVTLTGNNGISESFNVSFTVSAVPIATYTLNYTAEAGGRIEGNASQTVNSGENGTTVTAVPNSGYHFTSWSDGNSNASRQDTNVAININVSAGFGLNLPSNTDTTPVAVRIIGTGQVNNTLEAQLIDVNGADVTTSAAVTYRWYRIPSEDSEGGTLIGEDKIYRVVSDDAGSYIKLVVSYIDEHFRRITSRILGNTSNNTNSSGSKNSNSSSTQQITVKVTDGSNDTPVSQTVIERITASDGTKKDTITYTADKAKETIAALTSAGKDTARIVAADSDPSVSETKVNIPKETLSALSSGSVNLQIETGGAIVSLPKESVQGLAGSGQLNGDLYFRLVPINDTVKQTEIKTTADKEATIKLITGNKGVQVLGTPMTIETNMSQRAVDIVLPLKGVIIPTNPNERQAFLNDLGVFIEHSDGEKVLEKGQVVEYSPGVFGLKFTVNKFSDFTIVKLNKSNKTGWVKDNGYWYFFDKTGTMITGWYKAEAGDWTFDSKDTVGQWFHLGKEGKMDMGWFKDTDGSWYFLCDGKDYGALGYMETGWKFIDGKWYFLKGNGAMATGWTYVDGNWHYLQANGSMASNTVVDGYTLNASGAWVQ
ncbi:beta strand repeat-containing protein [Clostridium saccharoperbutylacetonicum]|uniref:beta strand repeat-containing protein n=1 Tax=Clostridium saccharoperbutylacetonicum TaxID=36745 RepID=UPI0015712C3A|nr:InlB B-repeat-containing protein [Clostridium saccharoperbutylacetonicum]NSB30333.1 putative repeat protein (TIGR02543 family) [Clostridium saccharoperbutylacetonicum]